MKALMEFEPANNGKIVDLLMTATPPIQLSILTTNSF